ncbi:unnamed protein product [Musa banksii]
MKELHKGGVTGVEVLFQRQRAVRGGLGRREVRRARDRELGEGQPVPRTVPAGGAARVRGVPVLRRGQLPGEWVIGQSHGRGMQTCSDGSCYAGEFKCGVKHGLGRYRFRNGDTYSGEYFGDKIHGFGVYSFANGHCYEGSWHEGRRQGLGTYTFGNGDSRSGEWDCGILKNRFSQRTLPSSELSRLQRRPQRMCPSPAGGGSKSTCRFSSKQGSHGCSSCCSQSSPEREGRQIL